MGRLGVHPLGAQIAKTLEARDSGDTVAVPAFVLDVPMPTTIRLGDTFVGGFMEACARALSQG